MSLGLRQAGFEILRAYDVWPVAVENYNRNIGSHAAVADLRNLLSTVPEIVRLAPDLIAGGTPCQDYSSAGKQTEADNASLTMAFTLIVTSVRPQWFLMENVIGCAKSKTWAEARAILKRAGYGISESKVNASHYGVPQSRRRLFVIGRIGERDGFLASSIAAAAASRPMTLRDLFGRRDPFCRTHPDDATLIENGHVYSRPVRAGRGVRSIDEPFPTVTRTAWERPTPRYLSAPHPADPVAASTTAVLTVPQISRIQGFPASWQWRASSKHDILQMIANAVPSPVAASIGRVILDREAGRTAPELQGGFLQWLVKRGRSKASARNVKAAAGRARRLLAGRTFDNQALEIDALERAPTFRDLRKSTQSDLRQALRLVTEYLAEGRQHRRNFRQPVAQLPEFAKAA